MATKIVTKNSSTASAVPTASDLVQGELAVNVADKRLFTEDNAGAIVELGTNPSTLTVTGEITANGGIALGDNDKATFGAGDDLQIYHDTVNSIIKDAGAGNLELLGNNLRLKNADASNSYLNGDNGGAVTIYHSGSSKLATTSTGIDVTGLVVSDGMSTNTAGTSNFIAGVNAGNSIASGGNYNTVVGDEAGTAITTGDYNVAVGYPAGTALTTGGGNVGIGGLSLTAASTGNNNTAVGFQASRYMTTASNTTAIGYLAGAGLGGATVMTGNDNTLVGASAGLKITTGTGLVAVGANALDANTTASYNTAVGQAALGANTTGGQNTAVGVSALLYNTTGIQNTASGLNSLYFNTTGNFNTSYGVAALQSNTTASNNTAVGHSALAANTTSSYSTAVGYEAGKAATGDGNTFIGNGAGYQVTTGTRNTFIGVGGTADWVGGAITTGSKNTIIGGYNGNQGGLDIRTSSNNIVLSDGDGNPRGYFYGGLSSPYWSFDNPTTNQWAMIIKNTTTGNPYGVAIDFPNAVANDTTRIFLQCSDSNADRLKIYSNGNVVNVNNSYGAISDVKLKENIIDASSQWDDIKALTVRKYSMKADNLDAPNMLGVIAQEVETAGMGGLVFETPDLDNETKEELGTVTKQVNYSILYMKAVKALQEAMTRIESLEERITTLEG